MLTYRRKVVLMSGPSCIAPSRFPWLSVLVVLLAGPTAQAVAQADADDEPFLPGLVANFRDARGHTASRVDHQLAFAWEEAPPDPRLAAGEFTATWQGRLSIDARGDYRFFLVGAGEAELKVGGKVAASRRPLHRGWSESPAVPLNAEFVPFELSFRRTGKEARLMVFWSGPQFGPEPVPARCLFHPREHSVGNDFERGRLLARVLRCGRCHGNEPPPRPAPALDRLGGNLARGWLVRWLVAGEHVPPQPGGQRPQAEALSPRRMPAFGLSSSQAEAIADRLLTPAEPDHPSPVSPSDKTSQTKGAKPGRRRPAPGARAGEQLVVTVGCLACHTWRDLGASGWLGGGDLTHVADKRPPGFFATWLADPDRFNRDHRMPVVPLSDDERTSLALFLSAQKSGGAKPDFGPPGPAQRHAEGGRLIEQFRCGACHRLAGEASSHPTPAATGLGGQSNWDRSCLGAPDSTKHRPGYHLDERDARALRVYYTGRRPEPEARQVRPDGRLLLAERNCLACHAREGTREGVPLLPPLLADKLTTAARHYPDLAPLIPALTPPALNSVGDKLTDQALADAVARRGEAHRPYLRVRMPRFPLGDDEMQSLVQYLVATDRVPERGASEPHTTDRSQQDRYRLAGARLVSGDGFGCTSCHQVGSVLPSQAPLNARGPDLAQLGRRIRRAWFDRWVRDPARIVPRMEMPSVQLPVAGVLDGKLDDQLAAVWHVLNLPGFEPPPPNPIRTLRHNGNSPGAEPLVVTDVLRQGRQTLIKPFLVGLANRHNVLLDLESAGLRLWTVGDAARQRTEGKAWFWEVGGAAVLDTGITGPDLALVADGRDLPLRPLGQFVTEADEWRTEGPALQLRYRLMFAVPIPGGAETKTVTLQVRRRFAPLSASPSGPAAGFVQQLSAGPVPAGARVRLRVLSAEAAARATRSADGRGLRLGDPFSSRITLHEPAGGKFSEDKTEVLLTPDEEGSVRAVLHYESEVPVDRFPEPPPVTADARKGEPVEVAPGFTGQRLPLPAEIMPTGLTWRPDGRLVFCSLKGQVFEAVDMNRDGNEDRLVLLADGLPAPYGTQAGPGYIDVSAKYAVLRLWDAEGSQRRVEVVASGWGYSRDYHDWAVGLPRNGRGDYFLGIPCQQDRRAPAAARFHGDVLRLVPRPTTADDPRRFALEPVSGGHRFPMGLALDRDGEVFVTDNQGNYNPFNELNHVRPGAHFGFVNFLERGKPRPPVTPPAIDIPHPWTRSVNGICFLYTPPELRAKLGRDAFGPLEGHLIGCEYDTRRLIRMTLQRVGDTYQGAAYPLSIPPRDPARGFLGPLVCGVSPRGELYVGSIRDSGWGAGNNVGEIVRVSVEPDRLPCGIAEVRATHDGFVLDFVRPVDRRLAGRAESYAIQSYRRESTPAYGGPDRDRRTEKVDGVSVAEDGRRVRLRLGELRPGFVYEFRLKNLAPGGGEFHPAEAYYTLRVVPR
jgi:mono/diheme cytochrome c family protein